MDMIFTKFSTTIILVVAITLICNGVLHVNAQRDYGEACSLRSQILNVVRGESGEGCMTSKGLVCFNHKCICADPSNVYEIPSTDDETSSSSSSGSAIASSVIGFFKGDKDKSTTRTTTTGAPATSGSSAVSGGTGGKCVGRAGSPCFTANSTCVKHATCEGGSPKLCKCQGIYGSNTQGYCSKSANVVNQIFKHGGSVIGRK